MSNKWVSALHDYSAGINSLPSCVDIGTGRYNMRLKVLKGLTLIGESVLTDLPSAVVPFINELMQPTLPSIAIASGPSILIYKNLKPFYKFNIPTLDVDESENEA
uniref:Bardet-Biedl syndrome 1 N-terminal domain-containing protein n=1 Tax=Parascaris equorum TaxID=6256 RepID=A0A914RI74_PAREQ